MAARDPRPARLLGLPFDETSSYRRGAAAAPAAIRARLDSSAGNRWTEDGLRLTGELLVDGGDLPAAVGPARDDSIRQAIGETLDAGARPLSLGGDHWVSAPAIEAVARRVPGLTVVQIDAHPDLHDTFRGRRDSHACPFARVMEGGRVERLVQIGIRSSNDHQREQASRFGVESWSMSRWHAGERPAVDGPVYVSVDLDGFDPAFAPAVAHQEAGGLAPREILEWMQTVDGWVGADLVELQPGRDRDGITTALAVKLVKELAGRLIRAGAGV